MSGKIHNTGDLIADRYLIENFVGEGGMQEVYLAQDSLMNRQVALKTPKNSSAQKRFQRSAVVSARINHPNVAKTLDYLEEDSGLYLVEEYIDGFDLQKALLTDLEVIDPYLVAKIFHHIAKGICASHHVGVVHRDLKPKNVMVVGNFNLLEIKITDFGIAKLAEEEIISAVEGMEEFGEESITGSQTAVGALPYMAPEMIDSPRSVGVEADIWSLGAMMYELLIGEKPFGTGLQAVRRIDKLELPPFDDSEFRNSLNSNNQFVPLCKILYDLILFCLSKSPKDRPSSDSLVKICEDICYNTFERRIGQVHRIRGSIGFLYDSETNQEIFFHSDSVYGPSKPTVGSRVCYSAFPGNPRFRAHPVVLLK
ncbi:serine/threonine-protein kinase [Phormidium tenue]|uniref:non-specific serine/threonine protein kinase n=1 Tax=Phormidium tenue NIES-30 TaxID=549789 RepID=A0A1U7J635_9CYAN|nr:serine/threonine-protein kinase [Phormidium tenue]MBD2232093.1 protein kinase [Phormidium tenue FACHB-1052]OKH48320.1 serine/threonine protein kinase [Phormidium tenue NIES-30]